MDDKRLARLESKVTKMALHLGIPLDKDAKIPEPEVAHIGYDANKDEPFIEVVSLHVSLYDAFRLYKSLETERPVEIKMRGFTLGTLNQPLDI